MPKCIYCLKESEDLNVFNREHVIPESFGKFGPETMVLNKPLYNRVCEECNSFFGQKLDNVLAKETFEGFLRFDREVKPPTDLKDKWRGRMIKMRYQGEGFYKGAIVTLEHDEDTGKRGFSLLEQIAFRKRGKEEWGFFEIHNVKPRNEMIVDGYDMYPGRNNVFLYCFCNESIRRFKAILNKKGIKIGGKNDRRVRFQYGHIHQPIEITETIDKTVCRGMAKILFNYVAFHDETRFVFDRCFNSIREFIREGNGACKDFIEIKHESILFDEKEQKKRLFDGHVLSCHWENNNKSFIGHVSLFNVFPFKVFLSRNCTAIYRPFEKGHAFCIHRHEIAPMNLVHIKIPGMK